ncbi:hypothetical protein N2152v2_000921 [Parachlorella kessleri]
MDRSLLGTRGVATPQLQNQHKHSATLRRRNPRPVLAAFNAEFGEQDGDSVTEQLVDASLAAVDSELHPQPISTAAIDKEIFSLALPGAAAMAADSLASLVSTAWVGRLGSEQLAAVGVASSLYLAATKLVNTPLLIVSVSTIAAALGQEQDARKVDSVGQALSGVILVALVVGAVEASALGLWAVPGLDLWGAGPASPLYPDAASYLFIRALTAPIPLLLLTLQGCCRGLGDSNSQYKATMVCNVINILLEPLFIFTFGWGVKGAAAAVALSQLVSLVVLLGVLGRRYKLSLMGGQALSNTLEYLRPTGLVMLRTLAVYSCFATATGIVARTDAVHTAAHQVCLQLALAAALCADSLSVAAQAMLAKSTAAGDKHTAKAVADRSLQLATNLGFLVMAGLGLASPFLPRLFTTDPAVLAAINHTMPFVVAIQMFYSLGFLMDGLVYGTGGYRYASVASALSAGASLAVMLGGAVLADRWGAGADAVLAAVWAGLTALLAGRFLTVYVPFRLRLGPFQKLAPVTRKLQE